MISMKVNDDEVNLRVGSVTIYSMNASYKKLRNGKTVHTPGHFRVENNGKRVI